MRLTQLEYFLAVYEYQNITKAAEKLHVSQPSITAALKELENEYNVNLFHRINKKMYLTDEGKLFYNHARRIINDIHDLEDSIHDMTGNRNLIRLGLPLQVGTFLLPLLINDFRTFYPHINLYLVECGAMDIIQQLIQENIDIAIAGIEVNNTLLNYSPLFNTEICFCVSKNHPLSSRKIISFREACQYPLVMFSEGSYTHKRILQLAEENHINLKIELFTKQLYSIINLILHGNLCSFLIPEAVALNSDIVAIPFDVPQIMTINTITKKNKLLYKDTKTLINFIKDQQLCRNNSSID